MELDVVTSISAEAEVKKYLLTGDDIYVKRYTNENIPNWYRQLISDIIAQDNTITNMDAAIDYLSTLPAGYNHMITELQNADTVINTSLQSLVATAGSHTAAIANLDITKVDEDSAAAIARTTVGAYFAEGSAGAWFNSQISTYASNIAANAMDISTLSATLDGHTVSIDTIEEISLAKNATIRSATAPTLLTHPLLTTGDLWVNTTDNVVKSWSGTAWVDTTNTDAINATAASATALAKLVDLEEARDGNVVVYYETSTAIPVGMTYGDYMVDTDSWNGSAYTIYRYESADGSSAGTLAWYTNTGETAKALSSGYRAQILAGTAQSTADGKVKTWYQISAPTGLTTSDTGDIWVDTDNANKLQVWSGSAWVDPTSAQGTQAYTWSANASKLITSPDGSVTGWSFGDGTNIKSYFQIQATNFKISDGTTGYTPFSIVGSDILFNGKVSFTNVTGTDSILTTGEAAADINSGTTTIDGGKITTGSIMAETLDADAITGKSIVGGTIEGTVINGVYINGSVIKTSFIDLSSSGYLTNCFDYTTSNPPGSLVEFATTVDPVTQEVSYLLTASPTDPTHYIYYRLPTVKPITSNGLLNATKRNDSGFLYNLYAPQTYYNANDGTVVFNGTVVTNDKEWRYEYKLVSYPYYSVRRYKYVGVDEMYTLPNINSYNSYTTDTSFRQVNATEAYNVIGSSLIFESLPTVWDYYAGNYTFSISVDGITQSKVIEYHTASQSFTLHGFTFDLVRANTNDIDVTFKIYITSLTPSITLNSVTGVIKIGLYANNWASSALAFSIQSIKTFQFPKLQSQ